MDYKKLLLAYNWKGYRFFDDGAYNVNLFGIRSKDRTADIFNDTLGIAYRDEFNQPNILLFKATTDPGSYFLNFKMGNKEGTAILVPGQYSSCFKIGMHKGYEALIQSNKAKFKVWRDCDQDGKLTIGGMIYDDVTGLNVHTTSFINEIEKVGAYSAGCQVIQNDKDLQIFLSVIKRSAEIYGDYFSYTLFDESDFNY